MKAADPLKEHDKPSEVADSSAEVSDTQVTLATAKVRTPIKASFFSFYCLKVLPEQLSARCQ